MQEVKFINANGEEIIFTSHQPYVFWKIDGLGVQNVETIYTQSPSQYGYSLNNLLLNERTITITGHIHGQGEDSLLEMYKLRRKLAKLLNPMLSMGKIIYKNDYREYEIGAFLKSYTNLDKYNSVGLQTVELVFECPFPFFQDTEQNGVFLNYVEGGLEFPLVTPTEFGLFGYYVEVDNDSDCDLPVEMYVDGGSLNPTIKNETTGEFIKIEKPLASHEKLYINTDPEQIEVSIIRKDVSTNKEVRENAYGYLTYDSTLFKLKTGINELTFKSDDEENKKVRVKIYYRKCYLGV